jgi:flagellar hook-length control protein FliK
MNDFRINPTRTALLSAAREDTGRRADVLASESTQRAGFDATLQRSVAREPLPRASFDTPAQPARDSQPERPASQRDGSAPADRRPAMPAPGERPMKNADPIRQSDSTSAKQAAGTKDNTTADATDPAAASAPAGSGATTASSLAATLPDTGTPSVADPITDPAAEEARSAATDASVTAGLVAASMAIGTAAAQAAAGAGALEATAETDADTGEDGQPDKTRGGRTIKASAGAMTESTQVDAGGQRPGALPELNAELTRTPARDRLMQDFEQRFENSLARAVGAPGAASSSSPLLLAGLPPQPMPAQAAAPMAQASIATPLSHPAFGDDLAHRVLLFAGQRVQSAEISLTPGELGPIRVSLELRGQEASVQFNASHAATRTAIEDALPRLREMLAAQGLQLTQADVGDRAPREQGSRGSPDGRSPPGLAESRASALGAAIDATAAGATSARRVGLIDIRV